MRRGPGANAATVVVLGLATGTVVNLATSGFDLGAWRWWLTGAVVVIGGLWAILEYRRARPDPGAAAVAPSIVDARHSRGVQLSGTQINNFYDAPDGEVVWPLRVGAIPPLASAFQNRAGPREQIDTARRVGNGVVLSGGGGVGKSQLAAWYATQAIKDDIDLVVWVNATQPDTLIAGLAAAAARIRTPGASGADVEVDARALLDWLATTDRSWLIVYDDITDPNQVSTWWPTSPKQTGWVLATTRRRDAALSGGSRTLIDIDVYSPDESTTYLRRRLTDARHEHLIDGAATPLAGRLGHLPLALSHAAAYMINQSVSCTRYLELFDARAGKLDELMTDDADGYRQRVSVTLLLALRAADAEEPAGLTTKVVRLAALLDAAGHPDALWTSAPVLAYLGQPRRPATTNQAHAAVRIAHRYALITHDPTAEPRSVRIHALTARAAVETDPNVDLVIHTAAGALMAIWPNPDQTQRGLASVLRANTETVAAIAGDRLWQAARYPVLYRAGLSLLEAGLHQAAITHWTTTVESSQRILGPDHPDTITARANVASSYWRAGRTTDAITIEERVLADSERLRGADHSDTIRARNNLATSYQQAGRVEEAIALQERVVADRERIEGPGHLYTVRARNNLAAVYWQAGRTAEATILQEHVLADTERILGPDHPDTVLARNNLATNYQQAGRTSDAITVQERVVADRERLLGPDHPDTLLASNNLAACYQRAGRTTDAMTLQEHVLAGSDRILGPDHPDTIRARNNLATSYWQAGRTTDAITLLERAAADQTRIVGPHHPDTIAMQDLLRQLTAKRTPPQNDSS
jgi:tetratricopeptide (TPR) repeat protein